ncbi:MAG: hypothetical protein LBV80_01655 [Deltaproteobacteria bacterium]|nr:hypothetical protein [Deltaproteobacteria bacterium]
MSSKTIIRYNKQQEPKSNEFDSQCNCIIVEGRDDALFFEKILYDMGYDETNAIIIMSDGKDKLLNLCRGVLKGRAFINGGSIKNIAIFFDADDDIDASFSAISKCFTNNFENMKIIKGKICESFNGGRFGIYMLPDNKSSGALEDICIELIKGEQELAESYLKCCELDIPNSDKKKRFLQIYLATKPHLCRGVGMGFKRGAIPTNDKILGGIKEFIQDVFDSHYVS